MSSPYGRAPTGRSLRLDEKTLLIGDHLFVPPSRMKVVC